MTYPVSIHAPARGATLNRTHGPAQHRFQSTRPRGARRTCTYEVFRASIVFQSTRPRGARQSNFVSHCEVKCFNPRARAGRDVETVNIRRYERYGFNPRARAGRDLQMVAIMDDPTGVSIHAPARGATAGWPSYTQQCHEFQSTRPRGARPQGWCVMRSTNEVSIHAPARGATGKGAMNP